MSALAIGLRAHHPTMRADNPRFAIARHVERRARLWALVWGLVFGLQVFVQARSYAALYPSTASRLKLAASLQSYAVLVGPARHTETVAGFTVWKVLVFCAIISAIWGVRASVGLLRGQEDTGQWELLASGPFSRRGVTAQALLGLGAALMEMFTVTLLCILAAGTTRGVHFSAGGSVLFAIDLVSAGAMFLAVGALTSQLRARSSEATTLGMLVLGAAYLVSMIANSRSSLGWLRWFTPIGWVEEFQPFRDFQPTALLLIVSLTAACVSIALILAARRDLLEGILRDHDGQEHGSRWLLGPATLALKLSQRAALSWLAGMAIAAIVYGILTRATAQILASSPQIATALAKLGAHRVADAFLGTMFLMYAVVMTVIAASQIAAIRDEEASGRLDNLLVRPVNRLTWLASRLGPALVLVLLVGVAVGFFTWWGAASQHSGVNLAKCLQAGLNTLAPPIFVLGAGVLVFGFWPRLATMGGYAIAGYSFLMVLLGSFVKGQDWIKDSSLFSHMALAPAATPDWGQAAIIIAIAVGAAAVGAVAFQRRDLESA